MLYPLSYGGSGALVAARAYNTEPDDPGRYGDRVTVVRYLRDRSGLV